MAVAVWLAARLEGASAALTGPATGCGSVGLSRPVLVGLLEGALAGLLEAALVGLLEAAFAELSATARARS